QCGEFQAPAPRHDDRLRNSQGGLLLRLSDRVSLLPQPLPRQLPAWRHFDGGDDTPGGDPQAALIAAKRSCMALLRGGGITDTAGPADTVIGPATRFYAFPYACLHR